MQVECPQISVKIGWVFVEIRARACRRLMFGVGVPWLYRSHMRSSDSSSSESDKTSQNTSKTRLPPTLRHRLWPIALSDHAFSSRKKDMADMYGTRNAYVCARSVEKRAGRGAARPQRHDSEVQPDREKTVQSRLPVWARAHAAHQIRAATKPIHVSMRETSSRGACSGAPGGRGIFPPPAAAQNNAPSTT